MKPRTAMMSYSGVLVSPTENVPTIADIALSLSRQPRFGGHTRRPWSVLDHTLFCYYTAQADEAPAVVKLALLLHDAHEALTGDVPTCFKTADFRALQVQLDARIFDAHFPGGYDLYHSWTEVVKSYDHRALLTEARLVGPPKLGEMWASEFAMIFGEKPECEDEALLRNNLLCGNLGEDPPGSITRVRWFELLVSGLQKQLAPVALAAQVG